MVNRTGYWTNVGGNIAVTFALAAVPLIGGVGTAVDLVKASKARTALQTAADAAALAAGATTTDSAIITELVTNYVHMNGGDSAVDQLTAVKSEVDSDGVLTVELEGDVETAFMRVLGISTLSLDVVSKVQIGSSGPLELALALDITGSMRDDMDDLKQGAKDLTNLLFDRANGSNVKVGIVPYVGAVNIGTDAGQMAWMDTTGAAEWNGDTFEGRWFAYEPGCVYDSNPGPDPGDGTGGSDRSSSIDGWLNKFADVARGLLGISTAHAADESMIPDPFTLGSSGCHIANPYDLNYFDLFDQIPNAEWKGCVEARAEPYDVDDTVPDTGSPDTLWVPYFWPDEPDAGDPNVDYSGYPNNYLPDRPDLVPAPFEYTADYHRHYSILEYNGTNGDIDETPPVTKGPNQACPDPIQPLTDRRSDVISVIDELSHWEGSGTNSAQGVVWGWRVLSPGIPFSEGAPYDEARKVLVLMTDGVNGVVEHPDSESLSEYSAYMYVRHGRIEPESYATYKSHIDDKMLQACENAKDAGVTIYTITFGNLDADTRNLYEQCATEPPYHFSATTSADLVKAFNSIGSNIVSLRLIE